MTGQVTLDGQPLPRINIRFIPEKEGGSPSFGGTNAEGRYTLHFSQEKVGAMLGSHRVEIDAPEPEQGDNGKPLNPNDKGIVIPKKYRQAGALMAEVKPGSNTIDFALQSR